MLTNYILVAVRNLIRQKGYALINIFGLALGISASMRNRAGYGNHARFPFSIHAYRDSASGTLFISREPDALYDDQIAARRTRPHD